MFARLQAQDVAETAAAEAVRANRTGGIDSARAAAEIAIGDKDPKAELVEIEATADGSVRVVVEKDASTLLIHRIDFLSGFARARGRATADPPPV